MTDLFRNLGLIVNLRALVIAAMAMISTWACLHFGITGDFPLTLIATAVVFPIVFSINSAYKRRESVLDDYGSIKAHGQAIYFASRDWLEVVDGERVARCRELLRAMLTEARSLYSSPREEMAEKELRVYACFSELSGFIRRDLREAGLATGEVSRCNQYLSKMMVAFEQTKHICQYRTPRTLKAFSNVFITVLPPLYGPYFAYLALEFSPSLTYLIPVLFALVLAALNNIQEALENPFDQFGQDDVVINAERFAERLEAVSGLEPQTLNKAA
jgi:predicted membrane chloride channel (bestrophin family)